VMARGNQGRAIFLDDEDLQPLHPGHQIAFRRFQLSPLLLLADPRSFSLPTLVLAWWLRGRTVVTLRWVSERLKMGHYTRVTQAISRMRRRPGRKLKQMQRKLAGLAREQE